MEGKKILILLNYYYPETNANVVCAQRYIERLKKEGCRVDVFAGRQNPELKSMECINGITVYRFDNWYVQLIQGLNRLYCGGNAIPNAVRLLCRLPVMLLKLILHLYDGRHAEPIEDNIDISEYVNKAAACAGESGYDCIIAFSQPFITMYTGMKIQEMLSARNQKSRFIICEFDPFTENHSLSRFKRGRRFSREKQVLEKADQIIIPPELEQDFRHCFPEVMEKVNILTFPNLEQMEEGKPSAAAGQRDTIDMIYVGNFYKRIRNPKRVLEILSEPVFDQAVIHIYGAGCSRELAGAGEKMGARLKLHGYQSREIVLHAMKEADITISIGNTVANQMPSKVFELIAGGKPILHFYRTDEDSSLRYLSKYPCMLAIDERENTEEAAVKISEFIKKHAGENLSFEEATKHMKEYTSEEVIKQFLEIAGIK